jgi:hypothetical protein
MSRIQRLLVSCVACAMLAVMTPSGAWGATPKSAASPSKAATSSAPLVVGSFDSQFWPGQGQQAVAIVDVVVDSKAKLPAKVRIPVPVGAVVEWAGEILGGNGDADIQRTFELKTGAGGARYAEFTLSKSHRGQIDTSGIPMTAQGTVVTSKFEFVQSAPSTSTGFSVRVPAGVSDVRIVPTPTGPPQVNSAGESLYTLPEQNLALGAATEVSVT